jgi:CDGSH-type Zn-finger protein
VSIVRIGLAEKKKYADGYDAIFGKKGAKKPAGSAAKKPAAKKASKKR